MSEPTLANGHPVNLGKLLETRLLIQANSGGGKSWALRRILEQTANDVQQIVIDPEGEFSSLREKFDYIICAKTDGDTVPQASTAKLLARRLLETGVSAIIDIYDLKPTERKAFVRHFFESLVDAPKKLWHPVLVILDEAHVFAPERGHAESLGPVIDLATRGRKRGFCLVIATQRLSKLHKDVAAEMNNKMIGRTGLDVDVARAAEELGMTKREAMKALQMLGEGEWYIFGPALTQTVTKIKVGSVRTSHPSVGDRIITTPPAPSEKVRKVLAQLADLPQQAEQEARTTADLKQQVSDLRRQLREVEKLHAAPTGLTEEEAHERTREAVLAAMTMFHAQADRIITELEEFKAKTRVDGTVTPIRRATAPSPPAPKRETQVRKLRDTNNSEASSLTGPQQRILDSLAWFESIGIDQPENTAVAFMAGYKVGGAYNNPKGQLNQRGLVQYGKGTVSLTDAGKSIAHYPDIAPTTEALQSQILSRLTGPEKRILEPLIEAYPESLSNEDLAARSGYSIGGAFNNPKGKLRTMGLIEYPDRGLVVARSILFFD